MGNAPMRIRRTTLSSTAARALIGALALLASGAQAADLEGQIRLTGGGKNGAAEMAGAVIYFEPSAPVAAPAPPIPFEVATVRKAFSPRVLAVPPGSSVRFPNQDPILHNVFSLSGANRFDLGLYRAGDGKSTTFDHPGVVRIFCNVHHDMVAYVLVVDTPYIARPDSEGRFRLEDIPDGPGTLTVWHERATEWKRSLTVPLDAPQLVELALSKSRVPKHRNKLGRPYARRARRY